MKRHCTLVPQPGPQFRPGHVVMGWRVIQYEVLVEAEHKAIGRDTPHRHIGGPDDYDE